jgi:hypothetical protein
MRLDRFRAVVGRHACYRLKLLRGLQLFSVITGGLLCSMSTGSAQSAYEPVSSKPSTGSEPAPHTARAALPPVPRSAQTELVRRYLSALRNAQYGAAYGLLNAAARRYYRDAQNFGSVYTADGYRILTFSLLGARTEGTVGSVFFARETARFRDHAHDVDLTVTATVPVGVVPAPGGWRIKDPGHPWRAFAARATADANGLRVTVKKVSFFSRRIETVVSFVNAGPLFVTVLAYGKSILRDSAGRPYRLIETSDWSLTDKILFEGLRLAPNAQYTGMLAFECQPLDDSARSFALTIAPLLIDGADAPFALDVDGIGGVGPGLPTSKESSHRRVGLAQFQPVPIRPPAARGRTARHLRASRAATPGAGAVRRRSLGRRRAPFPNSCEARHCARKARGDRSARPRGGRRYAGQ